MKTSERAINPYHDLRHLHPGRLLQPTGLKTDRAAVPPSKDLDPEVRKALREFLVASLDGYGDSPHVVDFAIRRRAPMMIGEGHYATTQGPALRAGRAKAVQGLGAARFRIFRKLEN